MLEEVKRLLLEYQQPIKNEENLEISFSRIATAVFEQELTYYYQQLDSIIKEAEQAEQPEEALKKRFIQLCEDRWTVVKHTMLSYTSHAESATNRLFWAFAQILFKDQTLGQRCSMLMPKSKVMQAEATAANKTKKLSSSNMTFAFEFKSLEIALDETAKSHERLKSLVAVDDTLFDLSTIANFRFSQHQLFFKAVHEHFPKLSLAIYSHNHDLSVLNQDLKLMLNEGLCIGDKLSYIAQQLRQGGETLTGKKEASLGAQRATQELFDYIDNLPEEFREKVVLLKVGSNNGLSTLASIITHLKEGNCVEQASDALKGIVSQTQHNDILKKTPNLSTSDIKKISDKYNTVALQALDFHKSDSDLCGDLPWLFLEPILENLKFNTAEDYILALTSLPETFYHSFLKGIKSTGQKHDIYTKILKENFLNPSQTQAFIEALREEIISITSNNNYFFVKLLNAIPNNFKVQFLNGLNDNAVENLIKNSTELVEVLKVIEESSRIGVINKISTKHLIKIVENGTALADILNNLPKQTGLMLIEKIDILHVKQSIKSFHDLIELLRWDLDYFTDKLNHSDFLFVFKDDYTVLDSICDIEDERLKTTLIKSFSSELFQLLIKDSDDFIRLLKSTPTNYRFIFIEKLGKDYLSEIITDAAQIHEVLENLSSKGRVVFIEKMGETINEKLTSTYDIQELFSPKIEDDHIELLRYIDDTLLEECKSFFKHKVKYKQLFEQESQHRDYLKDIPKLSNLDDPKSIKIWALNCLTRHAPQDSILFQWHQAVLIPELYERISKLSDVSVLQDMSTILVDFISENKLTHGQQATAVLLHMCKTLQLDVGYKKESNTDQYCLVILTDSAQNQAASTPSVKRLFSFGQ